MNIKTLALAGALVASSSAFAVTTTTGELVLGFGATGNVGASSNLEVALGTAATYTALSDGLLHNIGRLSVGDLVSTYGADWNTRSDLNWGIVGFAGSAINNTTWFSKEQTTVGTQTDPWARNSASANNTVGTVVNSVVSGLSAASATSNSLYSAVIDTSDGKSWFATQGTTGKAFKSAYETDTFNNQTAMLPTTLAGFGGGVVVSDLYKMPSGSGLGSYIGSFGISSTGDLYFASSTAAFTAVPEPSTYAMILGALTLGFVAVRRRLVKQV